MEYSLTSLEDTKAAALDILNQLQLSEEATVLALHGDLGAGKTTFTQELAQLLGVEEVVTSPTFVIMKGYHVTHANWQRLIHIDAYRIEDVDEMRPLRFEEFLSQKHTIICIEWAERIAPLLPPHTMHLHFSMQDDVRTLTINAS